MKIKLRFNGTYRLDAPDYDLVDENGNKIDNANFLDFDGTKIIHTFNDDYEITYLRVYIKSDDLFFKRGETQ
jgi:hypothetical protein